MALRSSRLSTTLSGGKVRRCGTVAAATVRPARPDPPSPFGLRRGKQDRPWHTLVLPFAVRPAPFAPRRSNPPRAFFPLERRAPFEPAAEAAGHVPHRGTCQGRERIRRLPPPPRTAFAGPRPRATPMAGKARPAGCGRFLWRLLCLSCRAKSRHLAVNPLSSVSPDGKPQRTARSLHSSRRRRDSVGMTTSFAAAACAPPLFAATPGPRGTVLSA